MEFHSRGFFSRPQAPAQAQPSSSRPAGSSLGPLPLLDSTSNVLWSQGGSSRPCLGHLPFHRWWGAMGLRHFPRTALGTCRIFWVKEGFVPLEPGCVHGGLGRAGLRVHECAQRHGSVTSGPLHLPLKPLVRTTWPVPVEDT